MQDAPGRPGIPPRWTSSDKAGIGTALSPKSRVWFTISHGIVNEVYYPRVDQACTRDLGLIVTGDDGFFSEEKRDTTSLVETLQDGVPAFLLTNRCFSGRYEIRKRIIADPHRDVLVQKISFHVLKPELGPLRVYALLAPHLVNGGADNTGWVGDFKGDGLLFAEGDGTALALAASRPFRARSVGFVGTSDGWQDISRNGRMTWAYERAAGGNVALTGELALDGPVDEIVLALGFGRSASEAAFRARATLMDDPTELAATYAKSWRNWQKPLRALDYVSQNERNTYRISTAVLRAHDSPSFPGGLIASLSIPWGYAKGDDDLGGYHLVWPRDLVETAGGLLAAGALDDAVRVIDYLRAIQEPDGHWPQNAWLDGTPYWQGIQLDECAFPIMLVDMALREGALTDEQLPAYWPMVEKACRFVMANGPISQQDRWEENAGFTPFSLAVAVASLLAGADLAERTGHAAFAAPLRAAADAWNADIEHWLWAADTALAREVGIDGYYVRLAPVPWPAGGRPVDGILGLKNRPWDRTRWPSVEIVSADALALVRFGLRAPDDPRIEATVKAIDRRTRVELPAGPCWRRYNEDGYGEHPDGGAFDGTGIGRAWPLLTGERAHYELAAGRRDVAEALLKTLEACGSAGGMLPEQVWDADDIPERELYRGRPTGSAMPLVWAHSEHIKLIRSLADGAVFDRPPQPVQRYLVEGRRSATRVWRRTIPVTTLPAGSRLRLELDAASLVHWSGDGWHATRDTPTVDTGLGLHVALLDTAGLATGTTVSFTLRDGTTNGWAGEDWHVTIV